MKRTAPSVNSTRKDSYQELDTEIEGEPRAVAPVVDRIMKEVATMGCAADHEFGIRLALSEAVANAVRHGVETIPPNA